MSIKTMYKPGDVIRLKDEKETEKLAQTLARSIEAGDVIALIGDLGTGKTAMTKYIAKALGIKDNINSQTFNIIKEYHSGRLPLYHYDVYRLGNADELLDIGGDDYFDGDGVCVIEWADIVLSVLPEDALVFKLKYGENEVERTIEVL